MIQITRFRNLNAINLFAFTFLAALMSSGPVHAETVSYTLTDVFLVDGTQMTGAFDWTYDIEDFEGGTGVFTALEIPWRPSGSLPPLEEPGMVFTIESNQIEISLDGNFHDWGLDITLKLIEPLSPAQTSEIDLLTSFFECCGNGFKDQFFSSGSISPLVPSDSDADGVDDSSDNCLFVSNPGQQDADADGHGNICDADFDQSCFTNFLDVNLMKTGFLTDTPVLDMDGSGFVNFLDFSIMTVQFLMAPGPSACGSCPCAP